MHSIPMFAEQLACARERAAAAGVADRVQFELRDYRALDGQYERIVSIEMIEAADEAFWPTDFAALRRALKPGGRVAIQGITIHETLFDSYGASGTSSRNASFPAGC